MIYRVADFDAALNDLRCADGPKRSVSRSDGPLLHLRDAGWAPCRAYQLTRPEVGEHFAGRRDF